MLNLCKNTIFKCLSIHGFCSQSKIYSPIENSEYVGWWQKQDQPWSRTWPLSLNVCGFETPCVLVLQVISFSELTHSRTQTHQCFGHVCYNLLTLVGLSMVANLSAEGPGKPPGERTQFSRRESCRRSFVGFLYPAQCEWTRKTHTWRIHVVEWNSVGTKLWFEIVVHGVSHPQLILLMMSNGWHNTSWHTSLSKLRHPSPTEQLVKWRFSRCHLEDHLLQLGSTIQELLKEAWHNNICSGKNIYSGTMTPLTVPQVPWTYLENVPLQKNAWLVMVRFDCSSPHQGRSNLCVNESLVHITRYSFFMKMPPCHVRPMETKRVVPKDVLSMARP